MLSNSNGVLFSNAYGKMVVYDLEYSIQNGMPSW